MVSRDFLGRFLKSFLIILIFLIAFFSHSDKHQNDFALHYIVHKYYQIEKIGEINSSF